MENDWDLQLSQQMSPQHNFLEQRQFEPDLMIQPITTQQNFSIKNNTKENVTPVKQYRQENKRSLKNIEQDTKISPKSKNTQSLQQQSKKFRQYLNQKVQQLKKSKDNININQNQRQSPQKKTDTLRNIIKSEQNKQKQNNKAKAKQTLQQPLLNNTNKNIQPVISSNASYKNTNIKKSEYEKRFSNSHSNLIKNDQRKDISLAKFNNIADIKKSLNLQTNTKTPKLPNLTPTLKIPFPATKNQSHSVHQRNNKRKSTIDRIQDQQLAQKQKRKTPESKNSFRIKRTSNLQPSSLNQPTISVNTRQPKQVSTKCIEKQKQSPLHQGKNKKLREQFMRLNEQERKLQEYILKHHQQTKKTLEDFMKKYQLAGNAYEKFGVKKQGQFANQVNEQSLTKSPQKRQAKQSRLQKTSLKNITTQNQKQIQSPLKKEKQKNSFLDSQLQKINNLLKIKDAQIKKCEARIQRNPYIQFLSQMPEDILEEAQEDELDNVEELPATQVNKIDFRNDGKQSGSTYSSVMSDMKNKKWGLKRRVTFETHRQPAERASDKKPTQTSGHFGLDSKKFPSNDKSSHGAEQQNENPYNKIEVNSRLRNLLLD